MLYCARTTHETLFIARGIQRYKPYIHVLTKLTIKSVFYKLKK